MQIGSAFRANICAVRPYQTSTAPQRKLGILAAGGSAQGHRRIEPESYLWWAPVQMRDVDAVEGEGPFDTSFK